jgi:hypothetical protein
VAKLGIIALTLVALLATACGSSAPKATATTPGPLSTITPAVITSPLRCHAQATSKHPRDHTTVGIQVLTVAHSWITATDAQSSLNDENAAGRASAQGKRTLRFRVGGATPGALVVIDVHVSRNGRKGTCQASFRPRSAPATAVAPTQHTAAPSPAPTPTATAASCSPLSNEGTCYEPGEFCRDDDHGVSGVAGDGETIICEDNDGWRWEPA